MDSKVGPELKSLRPSTSFAWGSVWWRFNNVRPRPYTMPTVSDAKPLPLGHQLDTPGHSSLLDAVAVSDCKLCSDITGYSFVGLPSPYGPTGKSISIMMGLLNLSLLLDLYGQLEVMMEALTMQVSLLPNLPSIASLSQRPDGGIPP